MVAVAKLSVQALNAAKSSKSTVAKAVEQVATETPFVYSTGSNGAGTMFDAFCATMRKPHIAKQSARKIVAEATEKKEVLENYANKILKKSHANAELSCRVKSAKSTANKIEKEVSKLKNDEESYKTVTDMILGDGAKEVVWDSFGMRFVVKKELKKGVSNYEKIFGTLLDKAQKNSKRFQFKEYENYHGIGIKPYGSEQVELGFKKLTFTDSLKRVHNTKAGTAPKASGYTRTNTCGSLMGVHFEAQIGGKFTTKWGNIEHLLYDMRQGKTLDFSHYDKAQKKLALKIVSAYKEVLNNPKLENVYTEDYLNKIWGYLRNSEIKKLQIPILPPRPAGVPEILSVENLMKLA